MRVRPFDVCGSALGFRQSAPLCRRAIALVVNDALCHRNCRSAPFASSSPSSRIPTPASHCPCTADAAASSPRAPLDTGRCASVRCMPSSRCRGSRVQADDCCHSACQVRGWRAWHGASLTVKVRHPSRRTAAQSHSKCETPPWSWRSAVGMQEPGHSNKYGKRVPAQPLNAAPLVLRPSILTAPHGMTVASTRREVVDKFTRSSHLDLT